MQPQTLARLKVGVFPAGTIELHHDAKVSEPAQMKWENTIPLHTNAVRSCYTLAGYSVAAACTSSFAAGLAFTCGPLFLVSRFAFSKDA